MSHTQSTGTPVVAHAEANDRLLRVDDLKVNIELRGGSIRPVNGISFDVRPGERLAIVGESGSGKSVTLQSILGLVPQASYEGHVWFRDRDLVSLPARELRRVRRSGIGMIFQDPLSSLNPVRKVGAQVADAGRGRGLSRRAACREGLDLMRQVGLRDVTSLWDRYPHELSGGMRQRVMIATALIGGCELLLADEPTTALDVISQARLIDILWSLAEERDLAVVLVSHDLGVVAGFAERVLVMYAGEVREACEVDTLFAEPMHPYTEGLLRSVPSLESHAWTEIRSMPGAPPSVYARPLGCAFAPRCPHSEGVCTSTAPVLREVRTAHEVSCHLAEQIEIRGESS